MIRRRRSSDLPVPVGGRVMGQAGHLEDHNEMTNQLAGLHRQVHGLNNAVVSLAVCIIILAVVVLIMALLTA
jgi:hypothetical protein